MQVSFRLTSSSLHLQPAVASTALLVAPELTSFPPFQLTVELLQWKHSRWGPPVTVGAPLPPSLPLRASITVVDLHSIAHLPLDPMVIGIPGLHRAVSDQRGAPAVSVAHQPHAALTPRSSAPSLLSMVEPVDTAAVQTSPFHLMDWSKVEGEMEVDISSVMLASAQSSAPPLAHRRAMQRGQSVEENRCRLTFGDLHLRGHPVLCTWTNALLPLLHSPVGGIGGEPVQPAATPPSSPPPLISFQSPVVVPSIPVRFSFQLAHLSCSLHHVDRTPLLQMRLTALDISASSSRTAARYEAAVELESFGLYVYDPPRSSGQREMHGGGGADGHHFEEHEVEDLHHHGRDCAVGISRLSVPLSIANAAADPLRSPSRLHLLLTANLHLASLRLKYSSSFVSHLPVLHSHYLTSHRHMSAAVLQHMQRVPPPTSPPPSSPRMASPSIPLIISLTAHVELTHVLLPVFAEDGFHALSLHLHSLELQHELNAAFLGSLFHQGKNSSLRLQSATLSLHHPFHHSDSPAVRALNDPLGVSHGHVHEVAALGAVEVAAIARSEQSVVDSIKVKVSSCGLSWSFFFQMAYFQIKHRLIDDIADAKALVALLPRHVSQPSAPVEPAQPRGRPYIVIASVSTFALEVAFTEWQPQAPSASAPPPSPASPPPLRAVSSTMTFFTHQLTFSHPAAFPFPDTPQSIPCPYPLPLALSHGWWSVNGVPMVTWEQAKLGGGRGSSGLPDVCAEVRGGRFRVPWAFGFGRDVQDMIDRWKAFKLWRKERRAARRERGRAAEAEQEKHRPQSPFFPYAVDFDLGCIWLRLLHCSFHLLDDPKEVQALERRRLQLTPALAQREADLRAMAAWRHSTHAGDASRERGESSVSQQSASNRTSTTVPPPAAKERKRRQSSSHFTTAPPDERSTHRVAGLASAPTTADPPPPAGARLSHSRSLNFEDERRQRSNAHVDRPIASASGGTTPPPASRSAVASATVTTDASQAVTLVQSILLRACGMTVLPFPPPSAYPLTAPLFSIISPDVMFTVAYPPSLQDMSQLYRTTRSLDPSATPPYAAFIRAEDFARGSRGDSDGSGPSAEPHKVEQSFLELWGRELTVQATTAEFSWRDFPLPMLRARELHLTGTAIIGQLQAPQRWLFYQVTTLAPATLPSVPHRLSPASLSPTPLVMSISRGAAVPTKLYYDMHWTGWEVDFTHGQCYGPTYSAMAEAFNRLTPPATPRVGRPLSWWDDLRYKLHGRLRLRVMDELNVRVMKSESPYRKELLQLSGSTVELLHTSSVFDGWGYDVQWTVVSDEHEGVYEGTMRGPDYVQGQLLAVPHAKVRVELAWKCQPLPDGRERHMFDHHLHHFPWNHPAMDVMQHYRSTALLYRVEVTVQPKAVQASMPWQTRSASLQRHSQTPRSPAPVSPSPASPSPSPSPHHAPRSLAYPAPDLAPAPFTAPTSSVLPTITLRWSAYSWFWHLIAMFQDPPLYLSPMEKRSTPSLGELFLSLSLSVLCVQPRVELLHEDARAPGRLNVLLLCAERVGVDWVWRSHYDAKGRKLYESQDMACDALQLYARAMVPEPSRVEEKEGEEAEQRKPRPRTAAAEKAELQRRLMSAWRYQQQKREEGEVVNFNDSHGRFCSPFDYQPPDYHSEHFLATRTFAYRTHYPSQAAANPFSPSHSSSPAAAPFPASSSQRSGAAGGPDQPPFSMPMQTDWAGGEWTALFGEMMGCSEASDAVDVIWEGRPWEDAQQHSTSSRLSDSDEGQGPYASVHDAAAEDEDDAFLRRRTASISHSDDGDAPHDDDVAPHRLLVAERFMPTRRRVTGQRPHSDGSIRYLQGVQQTAPEQPAQRSRGISDLYGLQSSAPVCPAFPRIDIGATRGRLPPVQHERDWSSCSHRFIAINLKLLWSNHIKRSVQEWMDVFARPYEPPAFVRVSQAAAAEWRRLHAGVPAPMEVMEVKAPAVDDSAPEDAEVVAVFELNAASGPPLQAGEVLLMPDNSRSSSASSSTESQDSDAEVAAFDMMALVRGLEDEPLNDSKSSPRPSPGPSLPPSRKSSVDGAADGSVPSVFTRSVRSALRQYEGRRADSATWLSLFSMDLVRPQINFQSRDTNSRLVLAAARARVDSEGMPIHVHRMDEPAAANAASSQVQAASGSDEPNAMGADELVLTGSHQLESYVYYEKKHRSTLTDAQAFVCPVDLEGEGRVQWVKDGDIVKAPVEEEEKKEAAAAPPTSGGRRKSRGALMAFWSGDKAARSEAPVQEAAPPKDLGGSGVLRKIVEPCTIHFAMTAQCNIEDELQRRQLVVADEVNGIVVPLHDRPPQAKAMSSAAAAASSPHATEKVRTLSQTIQLFLPAFSAHLDSNEYFTLLGVVQALFLSPSSSSSSSSSVADAEEVEEVRSPTSNKEEFQALMERLLDEDNERRLARYGRGARRKKVSRVVQYYVGGSVWQLFQHRSSPFIAAHVHGLHGTHTFFDDLSSDTEFAIHFLTLQSKLLPPGDPLANLLIPDPDRWMARDHKRDMMISVRAKVHAPLTTDDERVQGVTVYEHFEVTLFPLILRIPHDHYVCIRSYFFPQLQDVSEEEKAKATENFFSLPKKWRGGQAKQQVGLTSEGSATRGQALVSPTGAGTVLSQPRADSRGGLESSRPSSPHSSPRLHAAMPGAGYRSTSAQVSTSPMSSPSLGSSLPAVTSPPRHSVRSASGLPEPSSTATFTRPRGDSRALTFDLNRSSPVPHHHPALPPHLPRSPRVVKPPKDSKKASKQQRRDAVRVHYFRYIRINQLDLFASYHGETGLTSLENVHLIIKPFTKNQRAWAWQTFYSKLEKHLRLMVLGQGNHIIARKVWGKAEEGEGVHSLSQRFLDLFTAKDEEAEERKLLGFPKAVSPPADEGAAKFFRMPSMPSMPSVHMPSMPSMPSMPQLSLGARKGAGELAHKATLLFGNKKERQAMEKEREKAEKERRRQQKLGHPPPIYSLQPIPTPMFAVPHAARHSPPPLIASISMQHSAARPPLPLRPLSLPHRPSGPPPTLTSPATRVLRAASPPPSVGLTVDPTAPPLSPRVPDLAMLALLKKKSRPLPSAPSAPPAGQASQGSSPLTSPSSSPAHHPPPLTAAVPSPLSPLAGAAPLFGAAALGPAGPRPPPRPPSGSVIVVGSAGTGGAAVASAAVPPVPARPSLPATVRSRLSAQHFRSQSDLTSAMMTSWAVEAVQQDGRQPPPAEPQRRLETPALSDGASAPPPT